MLTSKTSTITRKVGAPPHSRRFGELQCTCNPMQVMTEPDFQAAGLVESDPTAALEGFSEVVRMEGDKGEW